MKENRLIIGALVLLALGGAAIWVALSQKRNETPAPSEAAAEAGDLPDLSKDDIDELEIRRPPAEGETEAPPPIRLAKRGESWRVVAPIDAEADQSAVNTALDKLDELESHRVAANNAANHARLEVDAAHGVHVIVRGGGETLADLWIGSYGSGDTNVRVEGQDRVHGVEGSIKYAFNKELKDWRNRRITDARPDDVREVAFAGPGGAWRFVRNSENEWSLPEGAAPIERFSPSKVQSIVSSLARMSAVDFGETGTTRDSVGITDTTASVTLTVVPTADDADVPDGGTPPPPPPPETITLRIGTGRDENREYHLVREGNEAVFVVSSYIEEKIDVTVASFQAAEPGTEPAPTAMDEPPMPDFQLGQGGGPGGGQIPPDVMRQIQQQLQKQGVGAHP